MNFEDNKYENFIRIDSKFYPVFNKEVDENNPNLWKSFIPHRGFSELLERVIKALSRENPKETKSIWLYGSYGTGKTHAVFVLKHLFEDKNEEVEDYLNRFHQMLYPYIDRIKSLRKEGVLVIYRSSAGHINSAIQLNLEIQCGIDESYKNYLKIKNLPYSPKKTDVDLLLNKLRDDIINWEKFLEKNRSKLYYISNKEQAISKLEKGDIEFASALIDCLRDEGIFIFSVDNVQLLKTWIEELFKDGYISRILFIWDEFSDFFKIEAPIFTFQELIHLTQKIPFYFIIVTHRPPDFWTDKLSEDFRKIKDRFINIYYTMENITIYKLIGYILQVKEEQKWSHFKENILNNIMKTSQKFKELLKFDENLKEEDIYTIFPLHPYSIYLMTKIVEYFGSANRTLFDFFKSERGFLKFLKEYPKNSDYLLTPDFLWDFFFLAQEELSTFYPKIKKNLKYFNTYIDKLEDEDEKRVFKTICLLLTLKEEIIGVEAEKIIKPTFSAIKLAFVGSNISHKIFEILRNLEKNKFIKLYKNPYRNEIEILEPSLDINEEELEKYKSELSDFSKFIKMYVKPEWFDIHRRLEIQVVPGEDLLKNKLPKFEEKGYKIPSILILTKEESNIENIKNKIEELAQNYLNTLFIINLNELKKREWEDILNEYSYYRYYENLDQHQAKYHKDNFDKLISNYREKIKKGEFIVYIKFEDNTLLEKRCLNEYGILGILKNEIIPKIYPYSFDLEKIILSEPLWKSGALKKQAIYAALNPKSAQKSFDQLINMLIQDKFLNSHREVMQDSFEQEKEHPIIKIKTKFEESLKSKNEISLIEIWNELKKPPFGFYDCPVGIFCFSFVLANYCIGYYGVNKQREEIELDKNNFQRVIEETISEKQKWIIRPLSKEEIEFCEFVKNVFKLNIKTPREAINKLREKIKYEFRYPLWIVNYSELIDNSEIKKMSYCLSNIIINFIPENFDNLKELFPKFYKILENIKEKEELFKNFEALLSNLKIFFEELANRYFYHIENKDISIQILDKKLRERLQEEPCYWKESEIVNLLELMKKETIVIKHLSEILEIENIYFIEDFIGEIINQIKKENLAPIWMYENTYKDPILEYVKELFNPDLKFKDVIDKHLIQELYKNENLVKHLFLEFKERKNELIKKWLNESFKLENDIKIIRELEKEFWNLVSEKPNLLEEEILRKLRNKIDVIKKKVLKNQIKETLKRLTNYENFKDFLEEHKIPIVLIKYLPPISKFIKNPDIFFSDLVRIEELSEENLEKVLNTLNQCEDFIRDLTQERSLQILMKLFLSNDWYEDIFNDEDLLDFINFYKNSSLNIYSSESELREIFNDWKKQKYSTSILIKLKEEINKREDKDLRRILFELIKEPEVGYNLIKIITKITQ